jgi:ribosome-binding protein aMBF1 (putative translation factor)
MSMKSTKTKKNRLRDYDRLMLRSAFVSLFWSVVTERRRRGDFTLQALAKKIGCDKSALSRWFATEPNWTLDTIADLAGALDLELRVEARERGTGMVFGASGTVTKPEVHTRIPEKMATVSGCPTGSFRLVAA